MCGQSHTSSSTTPLESESQESLTLNESSSSLTPASESDIMDTSTSSSITTNSHNDPLSTSNKQPSEPSTSSELVALKKSLSLPSNSWMDVSGESATSICLCKVSALPTVSTQPIVITHCLTVNDDLTWSLYVHNRQIQPQNCQALQTVPQSLTTDSLNNLLKLLDHLHVCCGQPDSHFISMITAKKGKIISSDGKVAANIDQYAPVTLNGEHYRVTVRTGSCELVSKSEKCASCKCYRDTLRAMYNRWCKRCTRDLSDTSSHSNERYLSTPEKKAKMCKLKERARTAEKQVEKLKAKIQQLTQQQGDDVDTNLNADLLGIMNENHEQIKQAYPEGSFARLFWEQQLKAASVKDARQVRWHPLMIKWCLNLKLISSAAYHSVRSSGFLRLPSERTLRDYTHYFKSQAGFQPDLNQQLHKEAAIDSLPESKRYIALLIDEIKGRFGV